MAQSIPQSLATILERAGEDFAILGGEEWCCGFPLIAAGLPGEADHMISHNLEKVKDLGAKKVVFSCPTCYRMWSERYQSDLELFHSTQLLQTLVREGTVRLGKVDEKVTYHDPCDLGRNAGEFDAPREILKAIPGLQLVEMENNRARSVCCGGGGNLEMADADLSAAVARRKLDDILNTGAKTVVSACQQCVRTMKSQARREKRDIEVLDVVNLVLRAMDNA
jgi:heterodisulfide reductase subunit D